MALTPIGVNLTALNNITAPNITISSNTNALIDTIHSSANLGSNGYFTFMVLITTAILFYIITSDKSGLTDFGYSDLKALTIAFGLTSIIGLTGVEAGFYYSYKSVVMYIILFMLCILFSSFITSKE